MQMIEYTTGGKGRRFGLFVHHTDADREFAYDRKDHVGKLSAFFCLVFRLCKFCANQSDFRETVRVLCQMLN